MLIFITIIKYMLSEIEIEEAMQKAFQEMAKLEKEIAEKNEKELKFVKQNINYDFDFIEDILTSIKWEHKRYVEVEKSDYKSCSHPNYDFYTIKNEKMKFMRQNYLDDDNNEVFHELIWQTAGVCEDDYSGFILIPLKNGKYWEISYSC